MLYKITWRTYRYGSSTVEAPSPEEAKQLALGDKDEGFEEHDYLGDWEIESVEPVSE